MYSNVQKQNRPALTGRSARVLPGLPGLPAECLYMLLRSRLGWQDSPGFSQQKLQHAMTCVDGHFLDLPPAQYIAMVLKEAELSRVSIGQVVWERLEKTYLPVLVLLADQWVFVERSKEGYQVTAQDGSRRICDEADLAGCMVIWVTEQTVGSDVSRVAGWKNPAGRMVLEELFRSKRWLFDVVLATFVVNLLAVSLPLFAMQVYDRVVPTLAYTTLTTLVVGMFVVVCLDWILKSVRARILDGVSAVVDRNLSQRVNDFVLSIRIDKRPASLGLLASQVTGLDTLRQFFSSAVIFSLVDLPFALMFIGFIALIGGPVALVYVGLLPIAACLGWLTQRRLARVMREQVMRGHERQGMLVDVLDGLETIRSTQSTRRFSREWSDITHAMASYSLKAKRISNFATVTTASLSTIAFVSALVVGVVEVDAGNLTMGGIIACSILGGRVIAPIAQAVQHLAQWQNVKQALAMLNQILSLPASVQGETQPLIPENTPAVVKLREVTFSYQNVPVQRLAIPELQFQAGERVLVLGRIGSGKSTLLKVLAGIYQPSKGQVLFDNIDLEEIDSRWRGLQIGYLPQSVHLFKGTLRSNLDLAGIADDMRVMEVANALGIDRIARDGAMGMDLPISEGGQGLSGGQKQLMALARLVLAKPTIWLLDEPTASLDPLSESLVLETLVEQVAADHTMVFCSHQDDALSSLATRALVLHGGSVLFDGDVQQAKAIFRKQGHGRRGVADAQLHADRPPVT